MSQIRIGSGSRIADRSGTHEPDEVVDFPTQALVDLATAGTLDPETGAPYCTIVGATATPAAKAAAAKVDATPPDTTEKAG